ncbi:CLUMA_CG011261, isoform A [Clunio marinus]|uniref:CLUMA_CG011261, isoform A n=1 Tax=Clunio marinus TaxID=568069 RepID=A0A1J1IFS7_9DIPT|nr:CLUMA_CG011261, isoform A [Clunio marinus]
MSTSFVGAENGINDIRDNTKPIQMKIMKHKMRHLSDERVNHKVFLQTFCIVIIRLSFHSPVMFMEKHNKNYRQGEIQKSLELNLILCFDDDYCIGKMVRVHFALYYNLINVIVVMAEFVVVENRESRFVDFNIFMKPQRAQK